MSLYNPSLPGRRLFKETQGIPDLPQSIATHAGPPFDPVQASASAKAHGRIGLVAWALFERGDGRILSFQKTGGSRLTIEIDSQSEVEGFLRFVGDLMAAIGRMTP
jgi:hypothetical protein